MTEGRHIHDIVKDIFDAFGLVLEGCTEFRLSCKEAEIPKITVTYRDKHNKYDVFSLNLRDRDFNINLSLRKKYSKNFSSSEKDDSPLFEETTVNIIEGNLPEIKEKDIINNIVNYKGEATIPVKICSECNGKLNKRMFTLPSGMYQMQCECGNKGVPCRTQHKSYQLWNEFNSTVTTVTENVEGPKLKKSKTKYEELIDHYEVVDKAAKNVKSTNSPYEAIPAELLNNINKCKCGSTNVDIFIEDNGVSKSNISNVKYYVKCYRCQAKTASWKNVDNAIVIWNKFNPE